MEELIRPTTRRISRLARPLLSLSCIVVALAVFQCPASADEAVPPPIRLVDMNTAGVLPKGDYSFESRLYEGLGTGPGILVSMVVGVTDRFSLGLGYGAEGLLGREPDVKFDPFPGCLVKYRIFDENLVLPSCAIGFDYQGFGGIADSRFGYTGYIYKSQGFFAAFSKSYLLLSKIAVGFHGDVNLSVEDLNHVNWPDASVGCDLGISRALSFVAEYDFGLNSADPYGGSNPYGRPQDGYLNAGVRWAFTPNLSLEFDARDIFENKEYLDESSGTEVAEKVGWSREIKVTYTAPIR